MPRASRSRVQVEIEAEPGKWALYKAGFGRIPEAELWISENIPEGFRMRAVRISGVFEKKTHITKR